MSWVLAIAVGTGRTWIARQSATQPSAPELLNFEAPLARDEYAELGLITAASPVIDPGSDPRDRVAAVLRAAFDHALGAEADAEPTRPVRILVTHPDAWSTEQVLTLRQAASRAGLGIDPVPEAVALASAYRAEGGERSRLLVLDADRREASAVARMGKVFVALATTTAPAQPDVADQLTALANQAATEPGVRRDSLDEVILCGTKIDPKLSSALAEALGHTPVELPSHAVALGALHYDAAVHEERPKPVLETPTPPPPPPPRPLPKIDHSAPDPKSKRLGLVPLLLLILIALVLGELLFVYWPF